MGIGLVVICVVTYACTRLSLDHVPGATKRANGSCCNTNFVNGGWWLTLAVVVIPIVWVAMFSRLAALVAVAVPTYATFHIASTTIHRYQVTGWGDGLEGLSYIASLIHLLMFMFAAAIGYFFWRRRRRHR